MSDAPPVTGPDLTLGYPVDRIPDGGMVEGHVRGQPVLLARRGAVYYAVGARCTHYSGPLADGIISGDTLHCPWHHACFDLRTGRATGGPALAPIPCYEVQRQLDLVVVTGRTMEPQVTTGDRGRRHPGAIVILGAGAAGIAAALGLRDEGYRGRLTLIDRDGGAPYDRPNLSKDYLAGTAPEEWLPLQTSADLDAREIRVIRGQASKIALPERELRLADGRAFPFDALLLATGAEPARLALPGADRPHVATLRSLADSRRLIARAGDSRTAVIIGAGFLGLEVAASLRHRGLEVHVVAPDQRPLGKVLGDALAARIQALHEAHGVVFHLGHVARSIGERDVTLDDGRLLGADLVLVATGARPATELAARAGIVLARGIQVDRHLETSVRGIYAAGDVARWPDPRTGELVGIEHWVFAMRQGRAAARSMLGEREPFMEVPFFWSQHYDVAIQYVGHAEQWDAIEIDGSIAQRDAQLRYVKDGRTLAVVTIGRDVASLREEIRLEQSYAR